MIWWGRRYLGGICARDRYLHTHSRGGEGGREVRKGGGREGEGGRERRGGRRGRRKREGEREGGGGGRERGGDSGRE